MLPCSRGVSTDHARSTLRIVLKLLGEFLREMAVLIAVFAPLDKVLEEKPLTMRFMLTIIVIVTIALGVGIAVEVRQWTNTRH